MLYLVICLHFGVITGIIEQNVIVFDPNLPHFKLIKWRAHSWHAATRRGALQLAQIQARKASREVQRAACEHGLINYKDTKEKCRHLKNLPVKGLCGKQKPRRLGSLRQINTFRKVPLQVNF